ncbi:MAG: DUF3427 domain-containing protein, partial [Candidatus Saccharibacteria bacterium]|nr:DUF3427 domain-containing protein [Candidatus Saccharibacteria bacterium]
MSRDLVLDNIRNALPLTSSKKVEELRHLGNVSLKEYLQQTGLELEDVYHNKSYWTLLRRQAGLEPAFKNEDFEKRLGRGIGRLLHIDDPERLQSMNTLQRYGSPDVLNSCSERELRLLNMILVVILSPSVPSGKTAKEFDSVEQAVKRVLEYPALVDELVQVADLLEERRNHIPIAIEDSPQIPLMIHCRYSRDEVLSAYGYASVSDVKSMREGVLWIPKENTDVLFVTLKKTAQDFSDSTMYKDYAISEWLFHWESQSTTSVSSKTGQRYLNHASNGTRIALFIRREKRDL